MQKSFVRLANVCSGFGGRGENKCDMPVDKVRWFDTFITMNNAQQPNGADKMTTITMTIESGKTVVFGLTESALMYGFTEIPVAIDNGIIELLDAPYGLTDNDANDVLEAFEAELIK